MKTTLRNRLKKFKHNKIDWSIGLTDVYLRFNGKCQKCNCLTSVGIHPQVPNSATIEHKVPLAMGGGHVWSNIELHCFKCNQEKNTEVQKVLNVKQGNKPKENTIFYFKIWKISFIIRKDNNVE